MFQSEKNPTKRGTFSIPLCHTIETRKTNVNRVQEGEPADTDLLHTDVVQQIGGRFFIGQNGRRTFPLFEVTPKNKKLSCSSNIIL